MELKEYFSSDKEIEGAKKIITIFHDRPLLDNKIKNTELVLLVLYMLSNKEKAGLINREKAKGLFVEFGKTNQEFDKAFYEHSGKRKGKQKLTEEKDDTVGLTFQGLERVKSILGEEQNG